MGLLNTASVAIDGSKFKAVNNRDKNFTRAKVERRRAQIEEWSCSAFVESGLVAIRPSFRTEPD